MKLSLVITAVAAALLLLYVTIFGEFEAATNEQAGYGLMIIILGALPATITLMSRREAELMPLMPLHGMFYAVAFGLPVFIGKSDWLFRSEYSANTALVLTTVGLLCLYIGYYSSRLVYAKMQPKQFLANIPHQLQSKIAWILYSVFLLFEYFPALLALPSVGQLATPLGYLSLGILFKLALDNLLSRSQLLLATVAIIVSILTKALTGFLAPAILFVLFLTIIYWGKKRRLPWGILILSAAIVILLNPLKPEFRAYTWVDQGAQSYYDKALLFLLVAEDYYSGESIINKVADDTSTIDRLAHIATFSHVIQTTPERVPYWMGGSYETLWISFIPRVLWPGKPTSTIGQEFGHRYGLLDGDDETTSVNLPWLLEFYANFGVIGVLVGMFAIGALFRFLVQRFTAPATRRIDYVLGITITFTLFYAESNLALMLGGVFLNYLAFSVLLRLVMMGSQRST